MQWGERIRAIRASAEESQETLASQIGVTKGAISQWENGTVKTIRPENLFALADYYRVEPRWIVFGDGPMRSAERAAADALESQLLEMYRALPDDYRAMLLADANKYLAHARPGKSAANPFGGKETAVTIKGA